MGSVPVETRVKANSVCVVGAGPSGIAAAKYLVAERAFTRITIFEQRTGVGGLWNYVPHDEAQPGDVSIPQTNPFAGVNQPVWQKNDAESPLGAEAREQAIFTTPVYERLETNIPLSLMGFSDLNWPDDTQLFPTHENVLTYLTRHAEEVMHLIEFSTQVLDIRQQSNGGWIVKTRKLARSDREEGQVQEFDAVIIANGHYDTPYIPAVPGIEAWNEAYPGIITHSKFYRRPEHYRNKKVIVVGNSASGIDIGAQVATCSRHPLLISQKSESYFQVGSPSPGTLEKPEIVEYIIANRSVKFANGTIESDIDAILYCTGYFYGFPFLPNKNLHGPALITTGERVESTYLHTFYRTDPSLAFMVLNQKVIPFPFAEAQAAVIARVFSGRSTLPTEGDMEVWERQTEAEMGRGRNFHVLQFPRDAEFINMLHDWAVSVDDGKVGKTPPRWEEKEYWIREKFSSIKKAFQEFGEERRGKRRVEDIGFDFE